MQFWTTLTTAWRVGLALARFRKEIRTRGAVRLSLVSATHDRRWLEREVLEFLDKREDSKLERSLGGLLDSLDLRVEAAEYLAGLLKSRNLDIVLHSTTTIGREQARRAILDGSEQPLVYPVH
jgi:hypothetical protein